MRADRFGKGKYTPKSCSSCINDLQKELDGMSTKDPATGVITYSDPTRANEIINTLIPAAQTKLTNNGEFYARIRRNS